jgi:hypothetical protein
MQFLVLFCIFLGIATAIGSAIGFVVGFLYVGIEELILSIFRQLKKLFTVTRNACKTN